MFRARCLTLLHHPARPPAPGNSVFIWNNRSGHGGERASCQVDRSTTPSHLRKCRDLRASYSIALNRKTVLLGLEWISIKPSPAPAGTVSCRVQQFTLCLKPFGRRARKSWNSAPPSAFHSVSRMAAVQNSRNFSWTLESIIDRSRSWKKRLIAVDRREAHPRKNQHQRKWWCLLWRVMTCRFWQKHQRRRWLGVEVMWKC